MGIIHTATQYLEALSSKIPVELFTFIGALVEEIIAPIPSPVVMTVAGSVASSQQKTIAYLLILALIGAVGKIIGSFVLYVVSDKAEDFFVAKFGKFLGVSQKDVDSIGSYFNNSKKRDFIVMFFARFIPIMPTAPISVVAGLLSLDLKTYLVASFLGYIGRNMIYLYFGYVGHESFQVITNGLDSIESVMTILIGVAMLGLVGWFYYRRNKTGGEDILKKFSKTK